MKKTTGFFMYNTFNDTIEILFSQNCSKYPSPSVST